MSRRSSLSNISGCSKLNSFREAQRSERSSVVSARTFSTPHKNISCSGMSDLNLSMYGCLESLPQTCSNREKKLEHKINHMLKEQYTKINGLHSSHNNQNKIKLGWSKHGTQMVNKSSLLDEP